MAVATISTRRAPAAWVGINKENRSEMGFSLCSQHHPSFPGRGVGPQREAISACPPVPLPITKHRPWSPAAWTGAVECQPTRRSSSVQSSCVESSLAPPCSQLPWVTGGTRCPCLRSSHLSPSLTDRVTQMQSVLLFPRPACPSPALFPPPTCCFVPAGPGPRALPANRGLLPCHSQSSSSASPLVPGHFLP